MTHRSSVPQRPLRVLLTAPKVEDFVGGQAVQAAGAPAEEIPAPIRAQA